MVLRKLKEAFSGVDDKYEVLYHKYSAIKSKNQQLVKKHEKEMLDYRIKLHSDVAKHLIKIYESIEQTKADSFKIHATSKELQQLMMDLNTSEKHIKTTMKKYSIEEIEPKERFYDPDLHEVATYDAAKGMAKGLILKTVKKGFKFRGDIVKKPRVVVTK